MRWRTNLFGQLGIGSTGTDTVASPVPVAGGFTFTSISSGYQFACGITSKLGAFCWGNNEVGVGGGRFGRLGSGLGVPFTDAPTPVATP